MTEQNDSGDPPAGTDDSGLGGSLPIGAQDDLERAFVVDDDMRAVEVLVMDPDTFQEVVGVLRKFDLDYVVTDRTDGDGTAVIRFPLPAQTVEHVQDRFEAMGIDDSLYTIIVDPEVIISDRFDGATEPYHEVKGLGYQGISRTELQGKTADLLPDLSIYVLLTVISSLVATAGVLLNSVGVLIGSMVIAPLIGPIVATAVGTVVNDDRLFAKSLKYQAVGTGAGLASATVFATMVRFSSLVSPGFEISALLRLSSHTAPNLLLLVVALGAGFAGALSLSTGGTIDLVGVMIAAAIMPPIGIAGVAVAWWATGIIVGSLAVVSMNLFAVTLAAVISLWYLGYHPESLEELRRARRVMLTRVLLLASAIAVSATILAHVSGAELPVLAVVG
ncbi:TIGR00341 family protein [Halosimplex pelagicum]|nr:TIGR00341 family protein [Halosimplex pelagicum]